ncbi:MAG TPA: SRPBCC domain-containing protein [Acidimicrobiales bacterium]|nr:SRPBCC domain-containing protein [Acidimicrobiales bacterium]
MTNAESSRPATRSLVRQFSVAVPVSRAWQAMTDPGEMARWFFPPVGDDAVPEGFDLYGTETKLEVLAAEPPHLLRYSDVGGPVPKVGDHGEVTVTFEDEGTGTRITITRSGFGDGPEWDAAFEAVGFGLDETIADFILYVDHGVSYPRHPKGARSSIGLAGVASGGGLEVRVVEPGGYGDDVGLRPGDLLIELDGGTVESTRQVTFVQRARAAGEVVEAVWVRAGELHRGTAVLPPWRPTVWPMPDAKRVPAQT